MNRLLRKVKYIYYRLFSGPQLANVQVDVMTEWLGNKDAGFYVDTSRLSEASVVYSLGVGADISFDLRLIEKYGCQIYAYDPTPKTVAWIESQQLPNNYHYFPKAVSGKRKEIYFYPPEDDRNINCTISENPNTSKRKIAVPADTLKNFVKENGHLKIDLLKIDIEGSEYELIDDIILLKDSIGQIAIEFHNANYYVSDMAAKSNRFIKKINAAGFFCAAINNCREYTFVKKA